jgi:hypothetical protein
MAQGDYEELYIITESGQTVFEYSFSESDKDANQKLLMASTLTAILQFIKVSSGQDLTNFKFGKHVVYIKKSVDYKLMYVLIIPTKGKNPKEEEINKRLETIKKAFEEKYSKDAIINWKGLIGQFDEFKFVLDSNNKKAKDILDAFKRGLW